MRKVEQLHTAFCAPGSATLEMGSERRRFSPLDNLGMLLNVAFR